MSELGRIGFAGSDSLERLYARAKPLRISADPIMAILEGDAKEFYKAEIPSTTRTLLAKALARTPRWVNDNTGKKMDPSFKESNLEHVLDLIMLANYVKDAYPKLYFELTKGDDNNWLELLKMLAMHDVGEYYTGDITATHTEFSKEAGKKHKEREAWAAKRMIRRGGGKTAKELVELYERFDRRTPSDTIVRFGHMLDKGQASLNVAKHVIPFNYTANDASPGYKWVKDMLDSIERPMSFAVSVAEGLQSKEAKQEFKDFLDEFFLNEFRKLGNLMGKDDIDKIFTAVEIVYRSVLLDL